jgi:predicted GNAT family acetyltransferase
VAEEMIEILDRPQNSRYDISIDGEVVGFCSYRDTGDVFLLPHAEVDPRVGGRGIGTQLVRGTLDDLRVRGVKVVALCPFVADFIARNPGYQDLVAQ